MAMCTKAHLEKALYLSSSQSDLTMCGGACHCSSNSWFMFRTKLWLGDCIIFATKMPQTVSIEVLTDMTNNESVRDAGEVW